MIGIIEMNNMNNWMRAFPICEEKVQEIIFNKFYPVYTNEDMKTQIKIMCILSGYGMNEEIIAKTMRTLVVIKSKNIDLETWLIKVSKHRFLTPKKMIKKFTIRRWTQIAYLIKWIRNNGYSMELDIL